MQQNCVFSITWNQLNQKFLRFASLLHNSTFWSIIVLKLKLFSCPLLMRAAEVSKFLLFRSKCLWIFWTSSHKQNGHFCGRRKCHSKNLCNNTVVMTKALNSRRSSGRSHLCSQVCDVKGCQWFHLWDRIHMLFCCPQSHQTATLQDASLPCKNPSLVCCCDII